MSRYRLHPTPAQQAVLRDHCGHARYTWNLAAEQHSHWHPGRAAAPGYLEQCRQLTGVPKAGWVRFRWSRAVPPDAKSYRVTRDRAGRWHVAFAVSPAPVPAPGNGQAVGIDRGVAVSAALSTGQILHAPALTGRERTRLRRMQRTLARATPGSNRRGRVKHAIARLRARESDRRKDWAEKTSTGIARRFDVIRVEDLKIGNMTRSATGTRDNPGRHVSQKAGLNRGILRSGWGLLVRGVEDKALGRVEKVRPALTSQRCWRAGRWTGTRVRVKPCSGA